MVQGQRVFYHVTIKWHGIDKAMYIGFTQPPVREDIQAVVLPGWRVQSESFQDKVWEYVLLLETIPTTFWEGSIESIYGSVSCHQRFMAVNGPDEPLEALR